MGGKSSSAQPATTTQVNKTELSPEQKQIYGLLKPSLMQAANADMEMFGGSGVADFNPTEIAAQNALLSTAGGTINDLSMSGAQANQFLLNPEMMLSPDQNPYVGAYGDTIVRQLTDNLTRTVLPGINRQSSATQGPYGATSRLGIAQGNAIGQTAQAGGDALAKLYSGAYASGLDAMKSGIQLNPQTIASQLIGGEVASAVGGQQRAMEQAKLDEEISKFYVEQQLPFLKAQDLMSMISGLPGGSGTSTVTGAMPSTNKWMSGLGGAASGAALGSTFGPWGTVIGGGLGGLMSLF